MHSRGSKLFIESLLTGSGQQPERVPGRQHRGEVHRACEGTATLDWERRA